VIADGWDALLAGLRELGDVEEVAPGRTVLRRGGRVVTILMTPEEWDELWGVAWGEVPSALAATLDRLRELADEPYAVYRSYELHPSATPEPARDPAELRIEQWMRDHPGEVAGTWHAHPPPGD
jgi:hypothetical protein